MVQDTLAIDDKHVWCWHPKSDCKANNAKQRNAAFAKAGFTNVTHMKFRENQGNHLALAN